MSGIDKYGSFSMDTVMITGRTRPAVVLSSDSLYLGPIVNTGSVVMGGTMGHFFKPEKNLVFFFRLKKCPIDAAPGRLE